jgi:hypothetical protein
MREIATTGLTATLVLLAWPWWFDRHREATVTQALPVLQPEEHKT